MLNRNLIGILILFLSYSCKKEIIELEFEFDQIEIHEGIIIASRIHGHENDISAFVKHEGNISFVFLKNGNYTKVDLPLQDYQWNDSIQLEWLIESNYYFNSITGDLFFHSYKDSIINNVSHTSIWDRKFNRFNINSSSLVWNKKIHIPSNTSFSIGEFNGNVQVLYNDNVLVYAKTYFFNYSINDGTIVDSIYDSSVYGATAVQLVGDTIYVANEDLYINGEQRIRLFDRNLNLLNFSNIGFYLINGFYVNRNDSLLIGNRPFYWDIYQIYKYTFGTINLETYSHAVNGDSYPSRIHQLENGNYLGFGYSGYAQFQAQIPYSQINLTVSEFNASTNQFSFYKEIKYKNGIKYINSSYLGERRFRILANLGSLYDSKQQHILFTINLDELNNR